jgi:hypothetical protein
MKKQVQDYKIYQILVKEKYKYIVYQVIDK